MSFTLTDLLQQEICKCCAWMKALGYSSETTKRYRVVFRSFGRWVAEQEDLATLSDLSTQKLQEYIIAVSLRPSQRDPETFLSSSSLNGHISALRWLFKYLHKHGKLLIDPCLELSRPRDIRGLPRAVLTFQEVLKIFSLIDITQPQGIRNRAALEILYSTGIRRGEMERLNLESVQFEERLLLVDGKGGKQRFVPIGKEAFRCLKAYLEQARPLYSSGPCEALFLSHRGARLKMRHILKAVKEYAVQAEVTKPVTLHSFRHTCATHMLAGKADIRYVQELLGHSSLNTTQIYTRVELSDLREVLDRCHPRDKF